MCTYGLVCTGKECTNGGANIFKYIIKIDQSEMTKSYVLNMSSKLTNYKYLMAKQPKRVKCC